jgi:hypothetical protein
MLKNNYYFIFDITYHSRQNVHARTHPFVILEN